MRIDLLMTLRIMLLDMLELRRRPKRLDIPVQIPQPLVNSRIPAPDVADVTFKVLHIHRIEPDYRRIQADIRLGDVPAEVVRSGVFREVLFDTVKGLEKGLHGGLIGGLGGGEAGFVDAVVDVVVGPVVGAFDFGLKVFGEEVQFLESLGENVVELGVEHADDFA